MIAIGFLQSDGHKDRLTFILIGFIQRSAVRRKLSPKIQKVIHSPIYCPIAWMCSKVRDIELGETRK